jgi:hypothetical protein
MGITVVELLNAPKVAQSGAAALPYAGGSRSRALSQSELQELWNDPGLHAFSLTPDKELARAQHASNSAGATS